MKKVGLYLLFSVLFSSFGFAAVGDVVHQLDVSTFANPGYTNGCSVGLAFDGTNLYYNRCSDSKIYTVDPILGGFVSSFDTAGLADGNPNAMAFDSTRNGIWFGLQNCALDASGVLGMPIYFWDFDDNSVTLKFSVPSTLINPATGESFLAFCFHSGVGKKPACSLGKSIPLLRPNQNDL